MQVQEYKTLFIGPSEIGKTSFLKKLFHHRNDINILDIPTTLGVEVKPITIHQNYRKIRLNVWDCAGNMRYKGLGKEYYLNADFAVIFKNDNINITDVCRDILEMCRDIPVLIFDNFNKYSHFREYSERLTDFAFQNL
jgi:GTPase SAR1 family protein